MTDFSILEMFDENNEIMNLNENIILCCTYHICQNNRKLNFNYVYVQKYLVCTNSHDEKDGCVVCFRWPRPDPVVALVLKSPFLLRE